MNLLNRLKLMVNAKVKGDKLARRIIKRARAIKRFKLLRELRPELSCDDISINGFAFSMGGAGGIYHPHNQSIQINSAIPSGMIMVDILFHEDRHSIQYTNTSSQIVRDNILNYIQNTEDLKGYYTQHIEKDARRYAYVKTCRFLRNKRMYPVKKFINLAIYQFLFHPFTGLIHKKFTK